MKTAHNTLWLRSSILLALVLAGALACKGEEEKEEPPEKKGVEALLSDGSPTLPEQFGEVPLWTREEELLAQDERFKNDIELDGFSDVELRHDEFQGFVVAYEVRFKQDDPLPAFTEKWGEPDFTVPPEDEDDTAENIWFNPEADLRASLESGRYSYLRYQAYSPLEKFIGEDPAKFGFETDPLIGMPLADVKTKYAQYFDEADEESAELMFPPTEYGRYGHNVYARADEGSDTVDRFRFRVEFAKNPEARGTVNEILTAKYGEPKEVETVTGKEKKYFHADTGTRVTVDESDDTDVAVSVDTYTPYNTLIGSDKGKMGFETTRLIGLTKAQVKEEFADFVDDSATSLALKLPPTEYESYNTTVWLNFEGDKVTGYRFGIPFKIYPNAKDAIFAKLVDVYGEPKEEKTITGDPLSVFSESPRVVVKEDTISGGWDIEVGE